MAVANALPLLKENADFVTDDAAGGRCSGAGSANDCGRPRRIRPGGFPEQAIELALDETGVPIRISPRGGSLSIAGMSGGGKSTVATGLLERILRRAVSILRDRSRRATTPTREPVPLGDAKHEPRLEEAVELFRHVKEICRQLLGVQLDERPRYFAKLFPQLCQLRAETARPHWMLIDEAHHMMPPEWAATANLPQQLEATIFVTVHPEHVARAASRLIALVVAVGPDSRSDALFVLRRRWARTRLKCAGQIERGLRLLFGAEGTPVPPCAHY